MKLFDCLLESDKESLQALIACAGKILAKPVDLAYTDHTIAHKAIVHDHLDSFLSNWLEEQIRRHGNNQLRTEVMVLLSACYIHDIGMQMVRPEILSELPSLPDEAKREIEQLPKDNISEKHRQFARRYHHLIVHDWIAGSQGDISSLPNLAGLDGRRKMVAKVALGHNIWLTNPESYDKFKETVRPSEEPEGKIRLDFLAAFLRLADILDQDKRRVDMEAAKRLVIPAASKVHWWRHHYVNACRIDRNIGHSYPLKVAFRLPKKHQADCDWLFPALYSATVKEVEAEVNRLRPWLGESGIHIAIPMLDECQLDFDPDAEPMPDEVLDAFRKTWRQAEGAANRAELYSAAEEGTLTGKALTKAYSSLAAAIEIEDYLANVRKHLHSEFRDYPYSPLELKVENQPELRSALEQLEQQLQTPQAKPYPIVLVGAPGGGKTMLLRRYVWEWSEGQRQQTPLPVYIQSTRFGSAAWAADVECRLGDVKNPCSDSEFQAIVAEALEQFESLLAQTLCELVRLPVQHEAAMREALKDILTRTPLAVFFDGINELPPMLRNLGSYAIRAFVERYYRLHRVVVTSRTGDFRPIDFPDHLYCELLPMTESAVRAYWAGAGVSERAIRRFFDSALSGTIELIQTPMAAYMTGELLKLPNTESVVNHGRLFQRYAQETLRQWHSRSQQWLLSVEQAHTLLSEISFAAFKSLQVSFPEKLAVNTIADWLGRMEPEERVLLNPDSENNSLVAGRLLKELIATGLLVEIGQGNKTTLRFRHHTLQDYFAAMAISSRWEQLPEIIAQPIFHEAVSMLAEVVDDPVRFIERLGDATSDKWGFVQMLPLLFRVIGASRVQIPRTTLLRIFGAAIPLYSAVVGILSPFAVEVLCYLFSQVDWQVFGKFLAFIADSEHRPAWERELARVDAVTAINREGLPTPEELKPFFSVRIPPEVFCDYESAKKVLEKMVNDDEGGRSALTQVPLLVAGLTSSISLSTAVKIWIARAISRLSANQLGQLSAVFVSEACQLATQNPSSYFEVRTKMTYMFSELLLCDEDTQYNSGDKDFVLRYLDAWDRLGCKAPLIQRLVGLSDELPTAVIPLVLARFRTLELPKYPINCAWNYNSTEEINLGSNKVIIPDVVKVINELRTSSKNPFLVAWLYNLTGDKMPAERQQELELAVCAAGACGYFLINSQASQNWQIPSEFSHYEETAGVSVTEIIAHLLNGDNTPFLQTLAAYGLTSDAIKIFLKEAAQDVNQLTAIAKAIFALDRAVGTSAMIMAINQACENHPTDIVTSMIEDVGITPAAIVKNLEDYNSSNATIKFFATQISKTCAHNKFIYIKSLELTGQYIKAFDAAMKVLTFGSRDFTGQSPDKFASLAVRVARKLKTADGLNPYLERLLPTTVAWIREGYPLTDWFNNFARAGIKNGELSADTLTATILSILKDAPSTLRHRDRRVLFGILEQADVQALVSCLDIYLELCPIGGDKAGSYLGNGAWYCYLYGDFEKFLELSEQALEFSPNADWILANRAFALYLLGRPMQEVLAAYRQALAQVSTKEQWHECAVEDLEQHSTRRTDSVAIPADFIAQIVALGASLPAKAEP